MLFEIRCEQSLFYYDNDSGTVFDENLNKIQFDSMEQAAPYFVRSRQIRREPMVRAMLDKGLISKKSRQKVDVLKIKLGSKCNYKCRYCVQDEWRLKEYPAKFDRQKFVDMMTASRIDLSKVEDMEIWGGEPFVYWKTFKPLVQAIRDDLGYDGKLITITNGSLFDDDKAQFVIDYNVITVFSHDGPAQTIYRHETDYLDDPRIGKAIVNVLQNGRASFNVVPGPYTYNLPEVYEYIKKKINKYGEINYVPFSNEMIFRACKDTAFILDDYDDLVAVRDKFIEFILADQTHPYWMILYKFRKSHVEMLTNFVNNRIKSSYTSFCPAQKSSTLTIDVEGRNSMCHNAQYDGGIRMKGQLPNFDDFFVEGLVRAQDRKHCMVCPYIVVCNGGCPDLDDESHKIQCKSMQPYMQAHFAAMWFRIFNDKIVSVTSCDERRKEYYY